MVYIKWQQIVDDINIFIKLNYIIKNIIYYNTKNVIYMILNKMKTQNSFLEETKQTLEVYIEFQI